MTVKKYVNKQSLRLAGSKKLPRPESWNFCNSVFQGAKVLSSVTHNKSDLQNLGEIGQQETVQPCRANLLVLAGPKPVFATVLSKKRRTPKNPQPPSKKMLNSSCILKVSWLIQWLYCLLITIKMKYVGFSRNFWYKNFHKSPFFAQYWDIKIGYLVTLCTDDSWLYPLAGSY